MEGAVEGTRQRAAPRKQWLDNIREWSGRVYPGAKQVEIDVLAVVIV